MYELIIKTHFDAAHYLKGYKGACEELHGHTYRVTVKFEGSKQDDVGLVCDFKELKQVVDAVIDKVDHKALNEISPFKETSPSTENIARFFYEEIKGMTPASLKLKSVTVWESDTAAVTYFPS